MNVTDCGKCDFMKEENKYAQAYFEKEYGELYCSNENCKNPTKKWGSLLIVGVRTVSGFVKIAR